MRKIILSIFVLLAGYGMASAQFTETEPNNNVTDSGVKTITSNGTVGGSFSTFDIDIFKIAPGTGGTLNLVLTTAPAVNQVQLCDLATDAVLTTALLSQTLTYTLDPVKRYYIKTYTGLATGNWSYTVSGMVFGVLPIDLGSFSAKFQSGKLVVNWMTFSERNNDRFVVQGAIDGKSWIDLGTVNSKAAAGNSSAQLFYSFSMPWSGQLLAGFGIFGLLLLPAVRSRAKMLLLLCVVLVAMLSCAKERNTLTELEKATVSGKPIYIRLTQFDKDGSSSFSQVVIPKKD